MAAAVAAAALLATDSHAQTNAQWSQLVQYVGQQSRVILEMRSRIERLEAANEQQRQTINASIAALDQERCRVTRLTAAVQKFAVAPPSPPAYPTFTDNVACADLKSPIPPFPAALPAP